MNPSTLNRFANNPVNIDIPRSKFNRSHGVKFTGNVGDVIPFLCDFVVPGDTVAIDTRKVIRMQPMVTPIFDNVYVDVYYFFCPMRILWDHAKEFFGENTSSPWAPEVEYTIPKLQVPQGGFQKDTIGDYLGIPSYMAGNKKISALPFRAYALICNEWFRDQNLMTPVHVTKDDATIIGSNGSDQVSDIEKGGKPFIAAKFHDYFTSCLPQPQKHDAITFSLAGSAPVNPGPELTPYSPYAMFMSGLDIDNRKFVTPPAARVTMGTALGSNDARIVLPENASVGSTYSQLVAPSNLWADLSHVSQFSINELRTAFSIQRFYEKQARSGSRYREFIKAFFGVTSPDSRMQIPEYLGGNRVPLNVSQIEQTSATQEGLTPQGNLTGMSHTGDVHSDFTKSFTEHGYLIGVCVARYNHSYQQGIERHWLMDTVYDVYNPTFANLGEMAVKKMEIYADAPEGAVFGYQEAWGDYRYKQSRIAGEFRSTYATPLDMWHLGDYYDQTPSLSPDWIREDKTMLDRCLAVTSAEADQIMFDFWLDATWARPMPLYSVPGLIDHH